MCNAWNHAPGCQCGWGGDGHAGISKLNDLGSKISRIGQQSYASYVNPSARCPECAASVFFYQSPYGGRVYFDQLGPPWPKHPCTNHRSSDTITRNSIEYLPPTTATYQWQLEGWKPFICSTQTTDRNLTRIHGFFPDARLPLRFAMIVARLNAMHGKPPQDYMFYVNSADEWLSNLPILPVFVRKINESPFWCEITTLKFNERTLQPEPTYSRAAIPEAYRTMFADKFRDI